MAACLRSRFLAMSRSSPPSSPSTSLNAAAMALGAGGKKVAIPLMGIFRIRNGEIYEWKDYFDLGDFQRQMAG